MLWIHIWMTEVFSAGFPHSDICGSMAICASPQLFAAYHVFHRLLVPRHPPCALGCLTSFGLFASSPFASSVMVLGVPEMFFVSQDFCIYFSDVLFISFANLIIRHPRNKSAYRLILVNLQADLPQ